MNVRSRMRWACVWACAGTAGLGTCFASGETADAEDNPYSVISNRNVFHLNDAAATAAH